MVKYTANIYSTARFLESDRIEILRRGSKGLVGGAVHSWWLWPLPCTAPPDIPLLPLLPSTYCPFCILLTAPPENSFSCPSCPLLTAPPAAIVPLLLLRASDWCHLISWPLWQYRLWNFKGFLLKINCIKWNLEAEFVAKSFFFKLKFQKVIFFPNIKIQFLIIVDVSLLNVMNWKFK